ncbi:AraC family transcriptional regulator [Phreatobacter stygius]|uniref:AraC family transcriptional regulator n=1 Tax=Phreatobacter stygius TaxID=1940610 RepID=A0A4D7BEH1_9HYPH|nr:AraC family transcriptional regulator [Phreatobacter stygius]QCI66372.1 AraC family transcriptional regulator [Phreatobacter stygius]
MTPVEKALWFIEGHFADSIELDDIAAVGGVSRFYLTRAFVAATGQSAVRYLRGRRLSEAARSLADGAPDILAVALDAGYGSHEAFTRAFRDLFGLTPEQVRSQRHLVNVPLVEPIKMNEALLAHLETPRIEDGKALLIAGLNERYSCDSSRAIPAQWQRFGPHFGHVPGQVGQVSYGVCYNSDDDGNFDYLCGVEVSDVSGLPQDLARLRVAAQRYAVFAHRDHISTIRRTMHTIWSKWLPESGHNATDAPLFERYGEEFDPRTGNGGLEIWIPIKT